VRCVRSDCFRGDNDSRRPVALRRVLGDDMRSDRCERRTVRRLLLRCRTSLGLLLRCRNVLLDRFELEERLERRCDACARPERRDF